ncbi:MAG: hypothetical protein J5643_00175 [Lachnospiraceae bacterium]|nr:hypothetical protein [Lachnospiraceae bacterium]
MKKALVLVFILASVLLAACGNDSEKKSQNNDKDKNTITENPTAETTPTDVPSPNEEPVNNEDQTELEKADEELAEQVRIVIEAGASDVDPFLELSEALSGTTDAVNIFNLSNNGLEALCICPSMQSFIDDNFGDRLKNGNIFQSEKYKNNQYIISVKNLTTAEGKAYALQIEGHWKAESSEEAFLESLDEETAEELRHFIEIELADIDTYDEMEAALGDALGYREMFVLTSDGLRYLSNLPEIKKRLNNNYGDTLSKGNCFKSKKYKNREYIISVKLPAKSKDAMQIVGIWTTYSE